MIPLQVVGSKVLIYDIDDIKKIRELGITGILIGTLTKFPQQNVFLSKPLELSFYEVIWLVENNIGILVDSAAYNKLFLEYDVDQRPNIIDDNVITYDTFEHNDNNLNESVMKESTLPITEFINRNFPTRDKLVYAVKVYSAYKYMKSMSYYIMPGLKFGGELMCYPGDPLRYHSHLIVNLSELSIRNLIIGGRLSTGVKKLWVLIEDRNKDNNLKEQSNELLNFTKDNDILSFSIEWAGFG